MMMKPWAMMAKGGGERLGRRRGGGCKGSSRHLLRVDNSSRVGSSHQIINNHSSNYNSSSNPQGMTCLLAHETISIHNNIVTSNNDNSNNLIVLYHCSNDNGAMQYKL